MRLFFIAPLLALYLFVRVFWFLGGRKTRFAAFLALLFGALFPAYAQFFGGGIASLTIPRSTMLLGEFFTLTLFNAFILFVLRDLLILVCWRTKVRFWLRSRRITVALLLLVASMTLYGEFHALSLPIVKETHIVLPKLPKAMDGMRIVHLTDLHVANLFGKERIDYVVQQCNALKPDLVVITGDFVDGTVSRRASDLAGLARLKAPLGVWAVEGNHEHYGQYESWCEEFSRLGLRFLRNAHAFLEYRGTRFALLGLTDPAAKRFARELPDIAKAVAGTEGLFRIAMVHQPKLAPQVSQAGIDLMLSGHTHGGHSPLWSVIVSLSNRGFVRGLYSVPGTKGPMALYVSSGTGFWTGFLERIGTDNEIALITLKNKGS